MEEKIELGKMKIRLCAFGDPILFGEDGSRLDGFARQTKRFALFIYLACADRARIHRRDELIATFWPESDTAKGQNALRQALHVIRAELGRDVLEGNGAQELWLNPERLKCDVRSFTQALKGGDPAEALSHYNADFLERFYLSDAPDFGLWAERRRTKLKDSAIRAAQFLAYEAEGKEDLSASLFWWRRASELSPYHEGFIRRIVSLLAGSGNRGQAKAEFATFQHRLKVDLGVQPSFDTVSILEQISRGHGQSLQMWVGDRRRAPTDPPPSSGRRATDR